MAATAIATVVNGAGNTIKLWDAIPGTPYTQNTLSTRYYITKGATGFEVAVNNFAGRQQYFAGLEASMLNFFQTVVADEKVNKGA